VLLRFETRASYTGLGSKIEAIFRTFIQRLSRDFKLSIGPNHLYSFGAEPLCELGDSTNFRAKIFRGGKKPQFFKWRDRTKPKFGMT